MVEIGRVAGRGSVDFQSTTGILSLTGAGVVASGSPEDNVTLLQQTVVGTTTLEAEFLSLESTAVNSGTGLMMRSHLSVASPFVALVVRGNGMLGVNQRVAEGGAVISRNYGVLGNWKRLRLVRQDASISLWAQDGGGRWNVLDRFTVSWQGAAYAGLAIYSGRLNESAQAQWRGLAMSAAGERGLPSPWQQVTLNSAQLPVLAQFEGDSLTMSLRGNSRWRQNVKHFVYQPAQVGVQLSAHVESVTGASGDSPLSSGLLLLSNLSGGKGVYFSVKRNGQGVIVPQTATTGKITGERVPGQTSGSDGYTSRIEPPSAYPAITPEDRMVLRRYGTRVQCLIQKPDGQVYAVATYEFDTLPEQVWIGPAIDCHAGRATLTNAGLAQQYSVARWRGIRFEPYSEALPHPWRQTSERFVPYYLQLSEPVLKAFLGQEVTNPATAVALNQSGTAFEFQTPRLFSRFGQNRLLVYQTLKGDGMIQARFKIDPSEYIREERRNNANYGWRGGPYNWTGATAIYAIGGIFFQRSPTDSSTALKIQLAKASL